MNTSNKGKASEPASPGQFQDWEHLMEPLSGDIKSTKKYGDLGIIEDSSALLIRNFIDCVKSRETPWCPLEEGHRSTSFAHLANIALAVGQKIEWDPEKEVIINNREANELLHYEYRKPWDKMI
jgi:hypothetical protein